MSSVAAAPTSLRELSAGYRNGATTSVETTYAALRRIAEVNPQVNAFALVDVAGAMDAAHVADAELAAGHDRGPLHGIPVGVKDLVDIAGLPTTCGSASRFGTGRAVDDADIVARLRRAGAVVIGKTTLHEFAYGATGDRSVHGPTRNPHDTSRMSGGSSGGSAAAVAAGMVPLTIGTDTVGSVRVPAALCGVAGLKPSYGDFVTTGVYPCAPSLDHVGFFAADSADLALAFEALRSSQAVRSARAGGVTVGWVSPHALASTDERVASMTFELVAAGGDVVPIRSEDLIGDRSLLDVAMTLQRKEAFAVHEHHLADDLDLIDPEVRSRLTSGTTVSDVQYGEADEARTAFRARVGEALAQCDVLALPTTPVVAPEIGQRAVTVAGDEAEVRATLLALTCPWNLAGVPAVSIPAGRVDGLPVGLQLVTAPGRESVLLAAAAQLEDLRGGDDLRR